ncbi:E3 ubiquitin-protein ligase RNF25 isoform X1 [Arabidopsis lyrata subsp. lyrata]|uniref:E3 ubiquitin-protein ligase RNF25 isoform X1 n=1 Tax=Arabidopsis lyrata subsp. lyrata TaxID=81972 RepID=UPI000A29B104|nr:E3 ubiquitin-protein ligase RNF25 isoform X1 [Arabidopsis lyrata subsp. lyrata]|eukprot:XP_020882180.1 E3 ubiquitin-protein ligase RNF25 isoform X1 [Arabidopsis lyrata subsp. lyrata]
MTEEEVAMEVEALEAVYGEDCVILDSYPPHLHLHIKPRTADISSQQFVEAVVRIQAGSKYPDEPPRITLIESKGLDDQRQKHLTGIVQEKAFQLSSSLMLVELCEEAVERLTIMNHPDGDCPLCLYPLFPEEDGSKQMPFMKLMSCFHCFHCDCIIRWWNWLHAQKDADSKSGDTSHMRRGSSTREADKSLGNCPVCRKVFHASDI